MSSGYRYELRQRKGAKRGRVFRPQTSAPKGLRPAERPGTSAISGPGHSYLLTTVADTVPGLFTLDQSGEGQGAVPNQDNSINSAANPAARGFIVSLWATGQGLSDPDWADDVLASSPPPQPKNKVNVNIGGQWAQILYAGAAPGLAAVIQVNAKVPYRIKPGSKVPVVMRIGNATSQAGVTIAVR